MIAEFIVVSFATFIGWQIIRSLAWFRIPERLTTFLVLIISFGFTFLSKPSILIAFAATGGCAVLFRFIADSIEPWTLPSVRKRARSVASSRRRYGLENRIASL